MPPNRLALWPGMHLQIKKPGAPAVPLQVLCCPRGFFFFFYQLSDPSGKYVFKLITALLLGWAGNLGFWEVLQNEQSFPKCPNANLLGLLGAPNSSLASSLLLTSPAPAVEFCSTPQNRHPMHLVLPPFCCRCWLLALFL